MQLFYYRSYAYLCYRKLFDKQDILFQSHTRLQFSYMLIRQMMMKIKTISIYFLSETYAQNLLATYIKMLNTNTFYTELSEHINDKYTAKQLSEMVSFSSDEKTEIFDAKVTTPSPNDSKLIADAVGKVAPEAISRLKSKATLKIVDYAQLPTAPSSPNEIKNVIIAMMVQLLSVGISLLRAFLDKKMR